MKFTIAQGSRQGPRPYNQDRLAYSYHRHAIFMVLADGMGGHQHGDVAAEIAVKTMIDAFQRESKPMIAQPAQFLREQIAQVHEVIENVRLQKRLQESPRTTIVVALIQHNKLFCAHVGDSRAYLYRNGLVEFQTEDHSVVQSLLREGKIRADEVNHHPHRNKIYNCVGGDREPQVELTAPIPLREGDVVLLCSDGVWNVVSEISMAQHMLAADIHDGVTRLLDDADAASITVGDNMSAIALQWGERIVTPLTISTLDLPLDVTTTMMNESPVTPSPYALDLTDEEIEKAIAEIQEALGRTRQLIK
ncbi:protein phosphatase 2C domain-containing protein [Methylophilus sp. VKM B-3414]|jgi:serine/threonine protein phosphatase PrpC|uniref:PP2C family protein-serine/threonine phosphatase n=1 Tax=Methylophilus sp. VKM B-3414 TaxID=3076121 RepID=UPI0028CA666E|nr:protein phosphatase 2C domain-containing protein [Methylophilus sp. VKM B-3414]MDT7848559.1 protein phosphatase 2C domain-containing protein [Methylophilus sp. VKM B-3414]